LVAAYFFPGFGLLSCYIYIRHTILKAVRDTYMYINIECGLLSLSCFIWFGFGFVLVTLAFHLHLSLFLHFAYFVCEWGREIA